MGLKQIEKPNEKKKTIKAEVVKHIPWVFQALNFGDIRFLDPNKNLIINNEVNRTKLALKTLAIIQSQYS